MISKVCSKCGEEKELEKFVKDKTRKNGRRGICRKCTTLKSIKWNKNNPEKVKVYRELPFNRARKNAREKERWKKNPEKYRERKKVWAKNDREGLANSYICRLIFEAFQVRFSEITPERIQNKREQVMVFRALKSLKEAINE